ncbi:MAG: MBL fold metallo-hydrolase [Turneriella sp.]
MEILRWQVGNSLKNYQYIVCDHERNALVIDPLDTTQIGELIRDQKLKVKGILLTHEHNDHAAEAAPLQKAWHVPVYSSATNAALVKAGVTVVADGGLIPFSKEFSVRAVETPGHAAEPHCLQYQQFLL